MSWLQGGWRLGRCAPLPQCQLRPRVGSVHAPVWPLRGETWAGQRTFWEAVLAGLLRCKGASPWGGQPADPHPEDTLASLQGASVVPSDMLCSLSSGCNDTFDRVGQVGGWRCWDCGLAGVSGGCQQLSLPRGLGAFWSWSYPGCASNFRVGLHWEASRLLLKKARTGNCLDRWRDLDSHLGLKLLGCPVVCLSLIRTPPAKRKGSCSCWAVKLSPTDWMDAQGRPGSQTGGSNFSGDLLELSEISWSSFSCKWSLPGPDECVFSRTYIHTTLLLLPAGSLRFWKDSLIWSLGWSLQPSCWLTLRKVVPVLFSPAISAHLRCARLGGMARILLTRPCLLPSERQWRLLLGGSPAPWCPLLLPAFVLMAGLPSLPGLLPCAFPPSSCFPGCGELLFWT